MKHIKENMFFYLIFFPMLGWDCADTIAGAITGDMDITLKGVRGIGYQILVLTGYLWFTGQLFDNQK